MVKYYNIFDTALLDNDIYSFDIETSSLFYINGKWISFDKNYNKEFYANVKKAALCYLWAFAVNDKVFCGRKIEEFKDVLEYLKSEKKRIIWVHNLSFEFQFLLNITTNIKVFSRKAHKVIKCFLPDYNIEFRCTYMLSNTSLEKLGETYNLEHRKKVGDLDYNLVRNCFTEISKTESDYLKFDVLVIYDFVKLMLSEYGELDKIPLTQTGRVRREVKKLCNNIKHKKLIKEIYPNTVELFGFMMRSFSGGYTHANLWRAEQILNDVYSFDISSSYPAVMVAMKFPMSKFIKCTTPLHKIDFGSQACLMKIRFNNIRTLKYNNYISVSKCSDFSNVSVDNGRIIKADFITIEITEIDYQIICENYDFDDYEVLELWVAQKAFLPKYFVDYVLKLYAGKTKLKNTDEIIMYQRLKEFLNSLYGMCVTNTIKDESVFEDGKWDVNKLTLQDIEIQLREGVDENKFFLSYAWGIWVTAYARQRLWEVISHIDYDVVYCDTDSVKFVNSCHIEYIENINKKWIERLKTLKYDWDLLAPFDNKGDRVILGVFDNEGKYERFITLGAKKYAFEKYDKEGNLKLGVTVSGVPKAKAPELLGCLENFKKGFVFGYDCNKLDLIYIDNQTKIEVTDYQGNTQYCNYKYGICMQPTTYSLGLSDDFDEVLDYVEMKTSNHLSSLVRDNENIIGICSVLFGHTEKYEKRIKKVR